MQSKVVALKAHRVITPLQDIRNAVVLVENGKVSAVGRHENVPVPDGAQVIDLGAKIIAPGFIDLHHHGAVGVHPAAGLEAVKKIGKYLAQTGVTGWLPTTSVIEGVQASVAAMKAGTGGACVAAIHMEGPFMAPSFAGEKMEDKGRRMPSQELFHEFLQAAEGHLRLMTISPELPGALDLIREMRRNKVVPAIAHTKIGYDEFMQAVEAGARHVTHTYNEMTLFHHRRPGPVGAALTCDQVTGELISDGIHVSPPAIDMLLRCKGFDKVAIITDNPPLAGLPDGEYEGWHGRRVVKKDGISRFVGTTADQDHTMIGSEWPMDHNIGVVVDQVGVSLPDAIRMATLTPARIVDLDEHKGSIEPGKDADLVVIDDKVHVYMTMVGGQIVFEDKLST